MTAARRVTFKQADLTRALKSARAAGIQVARFEIDAEGKIVVVMGEPEKQPAVKLSFFEQRRQDRARAP